jgi:hypothetical protein
MSASLLSSLLNLVESPFGVLHAPSVRSTRNRTSVPLEDRVAHDSLHAVESLGALTVGAGLRHWRAVEGVQGIVHWLVAGRTIAVTWAPLDQDQVVRVVTRLFVSHEQAIRYVRSVAGDSPLLVLGESTPGDREWMRRSGLSVRRWVRLSALRAFGESTLDISRVGEESPDEDRGLIRAAILGDDAAWSAYAESVREDMRLALFLAGAELRLH